MKYKPFTSKHCTPSRFTSPLQQTDAVEKAKTAGQFNNDVSKEFIQNISTNTSKGAPFPKGASDGVIKQWYANNLTNDQKRNQITADSSQNNNNVNTRNLDNLTSTGTFIAQEGVGQGIKRLFGNVASKAFGVAGMLLSSQKAYAGPGENYWRKKELEKQGLAQLTQEDINNMPKTSSSGTSQAEIDEYYKDGIPEMSVEEAAQLGLYGPRANIKSIKSER